jgi:hypothetical protein
MAELSQRQEELLRLARDTYTVLGQYVSEMGLRGLTAEPCVAKALAECLPGPNAEWLAGEIVRMHNELLVRIRTAVLIGTEPLASTPVATPGDDPFRHCRG